MDYMEMEMARVKGMAHGNMHVRSAMLSTFSRDAWIPEEAVGIFMEQVDLHGWEGAFHYGHIATHFPHTAESTEWALRKILSSEHLTANADRMPMESHLLDWLGTAPVEWLVAHIGELRAGLRGLPVFQRLRKGGDEVKGLLEQADLRIEAYSMPGPALRERIAAVVAECAEAEDYPRELVKELEALCGAAADKAVFTDEELGVWLDAPFAEGLEEEDFGPGYFANAALLVIAERRGKLSEGMVKKIVRVFDMDWDWTNELIAKTLERTADEESLGELLGLYPKLEWHARLFLTGVFEAVRIPGFQEAFQAAYKREKDIALKTTLAKALAFHGTAGAMETVRQHLRKHGDYRECAPLRDLIFCQEIVLGRETDAAKRHLLRMEDEHMRMNESFARFSAGMEVLGSGTGLLDKLMGGGKAAAAPAYLPDKAPALAGRNESCPCGSGKKYKKCCG